MNNFLKKSFNLMELSIYMMAVSMLASIVMGASTLMENAKVQKTIEEIYYYENAIVQFTRKYGQLPGNMSLNRCKMFGEFKQYCYEENNDTTITNKTTIKHVVHSSGFGEQQAFKMCQPGNKKYCLIQAITFGRFLQAADLINSVDRGLNEDLTVRNDNDKDVKFYLPKSKIHNDVYILAQYNNYHTPSIFTSYEMFTTFSLMGKGNGTDDKFNSGLTIYLTSLPKVEADKFSAFSPSFMLKLDKKMDDGKPTSGSILGLHGGTAQNNTSCRNGNKYKNSKNKQDGCQLCYVSNIDIEPIIVEPYAPTI